MRVSEYIAQRRSELRYSLEDLARQITLAGYACQKSNVWQWESEYRQTQAPIQKREFRLALAAALQVDVNDMMQALDFIIHDDQRSPEARRAAELVDHMPPEKRKMALDVLEAMSR